MSVPSEEDYIAWREDRVTRFIFAVCRKTAGEVFDSWVQRAWQSNQVDEVDLREARTRSDAYLALEQSDYSDWIAKSETPEADIPLPVARRELDSSYANRRTEFRIGGAAVVAMIAFGLGAWIF